jgi:hypothetical protein
MRKIFDLSPTRGAARNATTAKHTRELTGAELDRIAAAGGDHTLGSGPSRGGNLLSNAELDRVSAAGGSGRGGFGGGGGGSGSGGGSGGKQYGYSTT